MTRSEFEGLEDFEHMMFIGENIQTTVSSISFDKKKVVIVASKGKEAREYDPYEYFQLAMMYVAMETEKEIAEEERIRRLVQGKNSHIQHAEKIKRTMEDYPTCKKYNLDSFINQYNGLIEMAQATLQAKLLRSQIAANDSSVEANRISKTTNTYIAIFTSVAGIYYIIQLAIILVPLEYIHRTTAIYLIFYSSVGITLLLLGLRKYRK